MEKVNDTIELLSGKVDFKRGGPSVRICSDLQSTSEFTQNSQSLEQNAKMMKQLCAKQNT